MTMADASAQPAGFGRPPTAALRLPRLPTSADSRLDEQEALELHEIQTREDDELNYSSPSASSGDEGPPRPIRRTTTRPSVRRARESRKGLWGQFTRFWGRHVTLTVPQKDNRDHYALERTFLAYIRTSLVIAMQGVLIAQVFRLQPSQSTEDRLKFYHVGIPLSTACHCVAALVALIGAYRFWRQQNAIARGKVFAGGWELNLVGILLCAIVTTTMVLSIAILTDLSAPPSAFVKRILRR